MRTKFTSRSDYIFAAVVCVVCLEMTSFLFSSYLLSISIFIVIPFKVLKTAAKANKKLANKWITIRENYSELGIELGKVKTKKKNSCNRNDVICACQKWRCWNVVKIERNAQHTLTHKLTRDMILERKGRRKCVYRSGWTQHGHAPLAFHSLVHSTICECSLLGHGANDWIGSGIHRSIGFCKYYVCVHVFIHADVIVCVEWRIYDNIVLAKHATIVRGLCMPYEFRWLACIRRSVLETHKLTALESERDVLVPLRIHFFFLHIINSMFYVLVSCMLSNAMNTGIYYYLNTNVKTKHSNVTYSHFLLPHIFSTLMKCK